MADCAGGIEEAHLWRYAAALAPMAGSLASLEARTAHTAAVEALSRALPRLQRSASLLAGLNAMSATEVLAFKFLLAAKAQQTVSAFTS